MPVQRPREANADVELSSEIDSYDTTQDAPHDDADRDVIEPEPPRPSHLPADVDPGDAYEQSLAVAIDDDDYR